ncbi:hypothetical protein SNE40_013573 [Patella caerulea]|uniref:DUF5641 domain-containing protein n=1 Tax=Patella caerulea TaxID=87958 RepID=A0AAN8PB33_PATCE
MNDETLSTLFCEVEGIIKGRPITPISDDVNDLNALTPQHLLLLKKGPELQPGKFKKEDCYSRRRWRHVQYLSDLFWRRWTREYLPLLQERQKWNNKQRNFRVGDIILVVDHELSRCFWPLGRILEVYPNELDGCVRVVKVKTKTSVLKRPIDKCVYLESAPLIDDDQ